MKKSAKLCALILALSVLLVALCACGSSKLGWSDAILGDMLPTPPSEIGRIMTNTKKELNAEVEEISPKQSVDYVEECKELGFTVDPVEDDMNYTAYNAEGYKLSIEYVSYNEDMWIKLTSPLELEEIVWADSELRTMLPTPKSTKAMIESEYSTSFTIYMGETTKEDFAEYVTLCVEVGFAVDSNQSENEYTAKNEDGVKVTVKYEGNNIMSIYLSTYGSGSATTESANEEIPEETQAQTEAPTTTKATTGTGIRPEFKEAMDSYEEFMNDYVEFMKKLEKNPNDTTLLLSYAQYLADYAEFCKDFEAWGSENMNAAEQKYYIEVQTRVNKLLLEVAS